MQRSSGKRITGIRAPSAQQAVDPKTGKREIEAALSYQEAPPAVVRKKPTTSYPLPWKNKSKYQKTSDELYTQAGLGTLLRPEAQVAPPIGPGAPPNYASGEGPRRYQYAKEEPQEDQLDILGQHHQPGNGGAGHICAVSLHPAPFMRTLEHQQESTSLEGPGSNPPPRNGLRHRVPIAQRTTEDLLSNENRPPLRSYGPSGAERQRFEQPTDILGAPITRHNEARIRSDVESRRKAVEEQQLRSNNDHFSKVMKRSVLVDAYARTRASASSNYQDPTQETDIFGQPVNPYIRQQQSRSLSSKPSGGVNHNTQSQAPPRRPMPITDDEPLELFGNRAQNSMMYQTERRGYARQYPEDLPTYVGPTPVYDGNDGDSYDTYPYDLGNSESDLAYAASQPKRQIPLAVGPVQRFRQTPLFRNMVVAANGWGVCRLRFLIKKQLDNNRNTALASGCASNANLSRAHLRGALVQFGVEVTDVELNELMALAPPAEDASGLAAHRRTAAIPNPRPTVVDANRLLSILRRGEEPPVAVVDVLRQAYVQMQRNSNLRPGEPLTYGEIQNGTNFTGHSTFDALAPGSARKVTAGFLAAWAGVAATERVPLERFVDLWADVRMSYPKDAEFIKMIKAMYGLERSSGGRVL